MQEKYKSIPQWDSGIVAARAVACVMVIIIHISGWNFYQFSEAWWPTNVYDSIARFSVPVFFMISGALLLRKEEPLPDFLRKRAFRIFLPLLFWSVIYLQYFKMLGQGRSHGGWLNTILAGPVEVHLWYLYAIVGLYAFVPMLRKIYLGSSEAEKKYYLILWFLFAVLYPTVMKYRNQPASFVEIYHFTNFTGYVGFFFLGAYLYDRREKLAAAIPDVGWIALFMGASLATMLSTYWYSVRSGTPNELFYNYLSPFVVLASAAVFLILLGTRFERSSLPGRIVNAIADNSLGIYCIHLIVLERAATWHWLIGGSHWWTIPANAILALLISMAVIALMRTIPWMRHVA